MQLSLFLEVRKLLKLQGVAYLEGRLKSRSYGSLRHVFVFIIKYLTLSFVSLFVYLQVHKLVRQIPLNIML